MSIVSRARFGIFWIVAGSLSAFGQLNSARGTIDSIAFHAKGLMGVAAIDLKNGDTLTIRGDRHFRCKVSTNFRSR